MRKRIKVVGTGGQAPYGIGEIIEDFCATEAGAKKAFKFSRQWYNAANVIGAEEISHYDGSLRENNEWATYDVTAAKR